MSTTMAAAPPLPAISMSSASAACGVIEGEPQRAIVSSSTLISVTGKECSAAPDNAAEISMIRSVSVKLL